MNKNRLQSMTGGQAIVETLKAEEVKYIFGLIGSATMDLFDALYKNKNIKFIDVRDERTGTHMAEGYARASGKAGVIIAGQNGPGVTNLITGIAQAYKSFSPLISLGGDVASEHEGKDSFQEIDQQKIFDPITKKTIKIKDVNKIPYTINQAFKIALSNRNGPIHINLPRDVLSAKGYFKKFEKHTKIKIPRISQKDLLQIIRIINNSFKPVIIAGGGIKNKNNYKEVIELAKKTNIPIVSSAGHGDVIPFNEKLYNGQMGPRGNQVATQLVKESDLIIALGTRLGFNSTFYSSKIIDKNTSIIQIDIEKIALGRYFPISLGVCGDAGDIAKKICKKIKKIKNSKKIKNWTDSWIKKRKNYLKERDKSANLTSKPIQPTGIFKILRETLPLNSAVTLDAGTLCLQATDMLNFSKPKSLFTPLDFGLVGFSFACGLGVKLAKPNYNVISLMGDGGFGMTISELSTAVKYNINTITIVMNNKSWGAEKAYQKEYFNKRYIGSDIDSPPFHKLAELYGAIGFNVKKLSDFKRTFKKALKCKKPVIIDVEVDPSAIYSFRKDSFKKNKN